VRCITQIGTGNYNEKTAKQYTDLSLMTSDREIGDDAARLFNDLLVGNLRGVYRRLLVAPGTLKTGILRHIDGEIAKAAAGSPESIVIKCNSVTDREIMDKLAEASRAGVKIRLIVRGICCLVPGIENHTENITLTSIIGTFLEHSRIYCFGEGPAAAIYIASADLMTRNTADRVEVACPVLDKALHAQIRDMLGVMLCDNVKAWKLLPDGSYVRKRGVSGGICPEPANSQEYFAANAKMQQRDNVPSLRPPKIPGRPNPKRGIIGSVTGNVKNRAIEFYSRFIKN
jgi:polyphosphate kinase